MNDKERMFAGKIYSPFKVESQWKEIHAAIKKFNESNFWEDSTALNELKELFLSTGEGFVLTPPFYCDHGNKIRFGNHFYANTDLTILDENYVTFGDNVYLAPHVSIYTAGHPIDARVRDTDLEYAKPVTVGNDVWIGGNVVTKDIPDGVIAAGNPCRVIREITEADRENWEVQYRDYLADEDCN